MGNSIFDLSEPNDDLLYLGKRDFRNIGFASDHYPELPAYTFISKCDNSSDYSMRGRRFKFYLTSTSEDLLINNEPQGLTMEYYYDEITNAFTPVNQEIYFEYLIRPTHEANTIPIKLNCVELISNGNGFDEIPISQIKDVKITLPPEKPAKVIAVPEKFGLTLHNVAVEEEFLFTDSFKYQWYGKMPVAVKLAYIYQTQVANGTVKFEVDSLTPITFGLTEDRFKTFQTGLLWNGIPTEFQEFDPSYGNYVIVTNYVYQQSTINSDLGSGQLYLYNNTDVLVEYELVEVPIKYTFSKTLFRETVINNASTSLIQMKRRLITASNFSFTNVMYGEVRVFQIAHIQGNLMTIKMSDNSIIGDVELTIINRNGYADPAINNSPYHDTVNNKYVYYIDNPYENEEYAFIFRNIYVSPSVDVDFEISFTPY